MERMSLVAMLPLVLLVSAARATEPTDWFRDAKWGVMTHYLGAPPSSKGGAELTAEMWNKQVDGFDVAGLVNQLASTGAKYVLFTIGQNSGHYCSPNATYDPTTERPALHLAIDAPHVDRLYRLTEVSVESR